MSILDFRDDESLGKIIAVDTATVVVRVDDLERLKQIQVNRLAVIRSAKAGHHQIGVVARITRRAGDEIEPTEPDELLSGKLPENNLVRIVLIGIKQV